MLDVDINHLACGTQKYAIIVSMPLYTYPNFFLLRIESKQNSVNIIFSQRLNYDVKMGKKTSLTINQGMGEALDPRSKVKSTEYTSKYS